MIPWTIKEAKTKVPGSAILKSEIEREKGNH